MVMTDRGATVAVLTELEKSKNQPFHLVDVLFDPTPIYITDAWTNVIWNGQVYTALGHFLGFSDIEESADLRVTNMTVQLSGIDQSVVSAVLGEKYIDRPLRIRKAFFDENMSIIPDPVLIFEGRMDQPSIQEDPNNGSCTVTVNASSAWVDFERKSGRHTNHTEQQLFFHGDKGFEFISEITKEIVWGRK
jgi:hypothetical protein